MTKEHDDAIKARFEPGELRKIREAIAFILEAVDRHLDKLGVGGEGRSNQ